MSPSTALASLPKETLTELQRLVARLDDQDNDCTRDPIFEVREKQFRWSYGMSPDECEAKAWVEKDSGEREDNEGVIERLEAYYVEHDEAPEGWDCYGAWWETKHIQTFLTREAAESFVAKRGYHYSNPYISTETAYRNPELLAIQALLVALTPAIQATTNADKENENDKALPAVSWTAQAATTPDDVLVEQLRADPVLRRRLEGAVAQATDPGPANAEGGPYYIACFKRPDGYQTWWQANDAGYTSDLEQAGVYPTFRPGYHDTDDTVPVPVSFIKAFGGRIRRMVDVGDSGNQCFHSARALREALASFQQVAALKENA